MLCLEGWGVPAGEGVPTRCKSTCQECGPEESYTRGRARSFSGPLWLLEPMRDRRKEKKHFELPHLTPERWAREEDRSSVEKIDDCLALLLSLASAVQGLPQGGPALHCVWGARELRMAPTPLWEPRWKALNLDGCSSHTGSLERPWGHLYQ